MRIIILIVFSIIIYSCNTGKTEKPLVSIVDSLRNSFDLKYSSLPNGLQKKEYRSNYLDSISRFFIDRKKFIIGNIDVTVKDISNTPFRDIKAFMYKFEDNAGNEYWSEFDYPMNDDTSLIKNPAYKLIKDFAEESKITLSFFYMGEVEWADSYSDYSSNLKIKAIPFDKNYNFDSAIAVNQKKGAKN